MIELIMANKSQSYVLRHVFFIMLKNRIKTEYIWGIYNVYTKQYKYKVNTM